jgi:hypothetical protein
MAQASSAGAISESGDSAWRGLTGGPTGEDSWVAPGRTDGAADRGGRRRGGDGQQGPARGSSARHRSRSWGSDLVGGWTAPGGMRRSWVEASGEGALLCAAVQEEENDGQRREVGFIGIEAGRGSRGETATAACGARRGSSDARRLEQGRGEADEWGRGNLKFNMNSNSDPTLIRLKNYVLKLQKFK